jgi:putative flippase GtrA
MINEFLKYGVVGIINTLIDFTTFVFCTLCLGYNPVTANLISYNLAIGISFFLNRHFTFRMNEYKFNLRAQIVKFWIINLLSLSLSTVLVYLFSQWVASPMAKVISIPLVIIWGFLAVRTFVF